MNAVTLNSVTQTPTSSDLVDDLMHIELHVNDTVSDALIDGGSQVTAISDALVHKLTSKSKIRKPSVSMEGAAKKCHLTAIGEITLNIGIAEANVSAIVPYLIIKDLKAPIILGIGTQRALDIHVFPDQNLVTCRYVAIKTHTKARTIESGSMSTIQIGEELPAEQKTELSELIESHPKTFVTELQIGEPVPGVEHIIELTTDKPVAVKVRRYSPKEKELIQKEVDGLKKLGILRPS